MAHDHSHGTTNYNRAFAIGVFLNVVFVVVEAFYGVVSQSMALIADAGHNLSDVLGLLLAWGASLLAGLPSTKMRTYGFRKATILASLASAMLLLVALGSIAWEAIGRFLEPRPVQSGTVILVAAIGVVINTLTALLFMRGQKHDLNIRGAFLHMAADAGVSLGVVVAALIMMRTGWFWVDPVISLGIVGVVFVGTWSLLRESMNLSMDGVPKDIDIDRLRKFLSAYEGVSQVRDLHVWSLSTTEVAMTVHLRVDNVPKDSDFLRGIQKKLHDEFEIVHTTIQVDTSNDCDCNQCR
jgi:cobalt-zinc-cadmium efflux system protein